MGRIWELRCDTPYWTWIHGYVIDEIVLRAEPTRPSAAILQRLGNLPQARIPGALPAAHSY